MNIIKSFDNAFKRAHEKNWDCIYLLVDIHGTVFKPSYLKEEKFEFYPYAKEVLIRFSKTPGIKLILWTSSTKEYIDKYLDVFEKNGIHFDYVNENPEIIRQETDPISLDLSEKFYFNIGFDDKFGFDPEIDWEDIFDYLFSLKNNTL